MYKLRIYGLNAIYGLKIQISIGENLLTAVATGIIWVMKELLFMLVRYQFLPR